MASSRFHFPDTPCLEAGLSAAFDTNGKGAPKILKRELSPYSTTFPCEVVTCSLPGNKKTDLFFKYSAGIDYTGFGHRGGPAYELSVYREILQPIGVSAPVCFAGQVDPESGQAWLALEYLPGALGVGKWHRCGAMVAAARWIGQFHRLTQSGGTVRPPDWIKAYTRQYYLAWVRRTLKSSSSLPRRLPWLEILCQHAGDLLAPLLEQPLSIVHGEYYPHNVLYHEGRVYPVDWESAARAAGEIDIAALTEDWSAQMTRSCIAAYQRERWPEGVPAGFSSRFLAARLYLCFRWMGDHEDWLQYPGLPACLRRLRRLGRKLGVL
jgi:hypothetical protein